MTLPLTDDQIERRCERMMDDMDRRLLAGLLSQSAYDKEVKALDQWAQAHYDAFDAANPCAVCGRTYPEGDCCTDAGK